VLAADMSHNKSSTKQSQASQDSKNNSTPHLECSFVHLMRCVLSWQAMNLREITKKVGRNIGLNLPAVQLFTKQLLLVSPCVGGPAHYRILHIFCDVMLHFINALERSRLPTCCLD